VADLSESWCAGGVEVPVGMLGILDLVDQSGGQQLLDELHHARDGLDCPHVVVRWDDAQCGHVGPEQLGLSLGELLPVLTRRIGPLQQRIIHVRDVLDIPHRQAEIPPGPVHQVEGDVGVGVPQVRGVIRGYSAHIHAGGPLDGVDGDRPGRGRVVQPELSGYILRRRNAGNLDGGPRIHGYKTTACR